MPKRQTAPVAVASDAALNKGVVLKGTKLVQPVDVRVGSAVESRDPLKIERIDGSGTVVAPVDVQVTVPETSWQTYAIAGGAVVGGTLVVLFVADQAGAFDTQTTLIGAQPTK
jgi:hypothetical protein